MGTRRFLGAAPSARARGRLRGPRGEAFATRRRGGGAPGSVRASRIDFSLPVIHTTAGRGRAREQRKPSRPCRGKCGDFVDTFGGRWSYDQPRPGINRRLRDRFRVRPELVEAGGLTDRQRQALEFYDGRNFGYGLWQGSWISGLSRRAGWSGLASASLRSRLVRPTNCHKPPQKPDTAGHSARARARARGGARLRRARSLDQGVRWRIPHRRRSPGHPPKTQRTHELLDRATAASVSTGRRSRISTARTPKLPSG
jgi:hypothetical protein